MIQKFRSEIHIQGNENTHPHKNLPTNIKGSVIYILIAKKWKPKWFSTDDWVKRAIAIQWDIVWS